MSPSKYDYQPRLIPQGDISDYHPLRNVVFIYYYTSLEIPIQNSHRPVGDIFTIALRVIVKILSHAQNRCAYGSFF